MLPEALKNADVEADSETETLDEADSEADALALCDSLKDTDSLVEIEELSESD